MKVTAAFSLPHDHYDWNQGLYQLAMITRNCLVDNDQENFSKYNVMLCNYAREIFKIPNLMIIEWKPSNDIAFIVLDGTPDGRCHTAYDIGYRHLPEEYKGEDGKYSIPLIHSQEELYDTLARIHSMNILHKLEDEK
ncbi:4Fe-4S ferredoxin, iron-sulfur binding [Lacticaseibacillus paracasei subsp. paracasei]|uniref:4Fe-4S ferredoxin, iron-sulfur binding n=1 Tax=Lacticaseibacillus paracasei subsp. paracasei TaxID=47714 RepID=A0AAP9HGT4_LACPA|nr:hypothetical protein [Lacticaseibacillus paracasei]QGV17499.1 4Fe-4S ferredoxin, iron-sulfur binding [Lacticaseibacillus paracasei subsp. paracasei]